jgi:AcrR family transcriptional regulator
MGGRDALLDAGFEALVEEGPTFGTEAVVRRAGVSKGLLFHHFGSREGLLDAMAARVLAATQEGLARLDTDYPNPRERLVALARTLLEDPRVEPRETRHVQQFWLQTDATGGCRGALRDALVADYVAATVREGVTTGALRAGVDARAVSDLLLARWHGATTLAATGRALDFDREAERVVEEMLRRLLPTS